MRSCSRVLDAGIRRKAEAAAPCCTPRAIRPRRAAAIRAARAAQEAQLGDDEDRLASAGVTYARAAGMVQETYGSFNGAFLEGAQDNRNETVFLELWRRNPREPLGFRFGYVDKDGSGHLVVTRPKP